MIWRKPTSLPNSGKIWGSRSHGRSGLHAGRRFHSRHVFEKGYVITQEAVQIAVGFAAFQARRRKAAELPITDGNIILDDNLLACSEQHIRAVFEMLGRQKENLLLQVD